MTASVDDGSPARPLVVDALNKSQEAKEQVKRAADDLAVVRAVLDKQIPESERSSEVDQAVKHTDHLEKKLQKSVDLLEEVTKKLESGVERHPRTSR